MEYISKADRKAVQGRAHERCEYCCLPDNASHYSHQIDHIIPPRHGGSNEIPNFAWACFHCNNNKGTDIATYDLVTQVPVFLFNPRLDVWQDHFEITGDGIIIGLNPSGRGTTRLLQMNNPKRVAIRLTLIQAGLW
jgi:hypothetical protein